MKLDPTKNDAIFKYPRPSSKKQLQRWIGICNWRQKLIYHFSDIMSPLYELLKIGAKWQWTDEQETAFQYMKTQLLIPVLSQPNFRNSSIL